MGAETRSTNVSMKATTAEPLATSNVLSLSANWQRVFIGTSIMVWLAQVAQLVLIYNVVHYLSGGTLAFQLSLLLLPVVLVAIAWMLLSRHAYLGRLCLACIAAFIGFSLYNVASMAVNQLWNPYAVTSPPDTSWWSAFGVEWTLMAVVIAVYAVGLYVATRQTRR